MTIPINDLVTYTGDEWEDYLEKICLVDIFQKLIEAYDSDRPTLKGIIKFITWTYSIDSSKIVLKKDWLKNKTEIFTLCALDKKFYDNVVLLKDRVVLNTIKKWLEFQNDEHFQNWSMISDLIVEFRIAANSEVKKSSGEIDYETKAKCAEKVIELMKLKSDLEQKFIENNPKLKEAYKEVQQAYRQTADDTIGIETILKGRN